MPPAAWAPSGLVLVLVLVPRTSLLLVILFRKSFTDAQDMSLDGDPEGKPASSICFALVRISELGIVQQCNRISMPLAVCHLTSSRRSLRRHSSRCPIHARLSFQSSSMFQSMCSSRLTSGGRVSCALLHAIMIWAVAVIPHAVPAMVRPRFEQRSQIQSPV